MNEIQGGKKERLKRGWNKKGKESRKELKDKMMYTRKEKREKKEHNIYTMRKELKSGNTNVSPYSYFIFPYLSTPGKDCN